MKRKTSCNVDKSLIECEKVARLRELIQKKKDITGQYETLDQLYNKIAKHMPGVRMSHCVDAVRSFYGIKSYKEALSKFGEELDTIEAIKIEFYEIDREIYRLKSDLGIN